MKCLHMTGFKKTIDYLEEGVFSPNLVYQNAIGVLDVHHCVTIIGPPGSGKTITAVKLAYGKCELSKLFFCQTVEEIPDKAKKHKGAFIIVDDWIDKYVYYPSKLDKAIDLLSSVYDKYVRKSRVYLILTAQEDIWNRLKGSLMKCDLFETQFHVNAISEGEKRNMVHRHFQHFYRKENSYSENNSRDNFITDMTKLKNEWNFSFPVMIDLICSNEKLAREVPLMLVKGFSHVLQTFFDKWLEEGDINQKRSFCILVFAAFLGGKVSLTDFKSPITGPLFHKVCNKYKCSFNAIQNKPSDQEIERLLFENKQLRSCLYQTSCSQNDIMLIFHHSSLFRFLLSYIKDKGEVFFIENVHVEVLIQHCWIDEHQSILDKLMPDFACCLEKTPEGSVSLSTSDIETFAKRIYSEKEKGEHIPEWDDHIFMQQEIFKTFWENIDNSFQI